MPLNHEHEFVSLPAVDRQLLIHHLVVHHGTNLPPTMILGATPTQDLTDIHQLQHSPAGRMTVPPHIGRDSSGEPEKGKKTSPPPDLDSYQQLIWFAGYQAAERDLATRP